jgi:uncharacterized Zn-binding protein involved in type VI secretion
MPTIRRKTYGKLALSFEGLSQLSRKLARDGEVWERVQRAAVRGMTENTEDLLGRAMRDAPVDEGTLRASGAATVYANGKAVARQGFREVAGRPELPQMVGRTLIEGGLGDAVVGEVGFHTPYALAQHERLDFDHPKGGKAKYLEDNLREHAGRYQDNLSDRVRKAIA